VSIKIQLFNNAVIVDSGQWIGTSSIPNYTQIVIPITQYSSNVDSAMISIQGGHQIGYPDNDTEFWVDYLRLE